MCKHAAIERNQLQRINKPLCISQGGVSLSTAEAAGNENDIHQVQISEPAVETIHGCDVRK